jgi:hypothetical protein
VDPQGVEMELRVAISLPLVHLPLSRLKRQRIEAMQSASGFVWRGLHLGRPIQVEIVAGLKLCRDGEFWADFTYWANAKLSYAFIVFYMFSSLFMEIFMIKYVFCLFYNLHCSNNFKYKKLCNRTLPLHISMIFP